MRDRTEWLPAAAAMALAVAIVAGAASTAKEGEETGWQIVHEDSLPVLGQADAWRETFRIESLPPGTTGHAVLHIIDEPVEGAWDGPLRPCARFVAVVPARDFPVDMHLSIDNVTVWTGTYWSGSGTPLEGAC